MPNHLTIEAINPLAAEALDLLYAAAKEIRPLYDDFDPEAALPTNPPATPGSIYLIARLDGDPIGSIALRSHAPAIGEVRRMYVLPAYRRQQIASALLRAVEAQALELGYQILRLETGDRQRPAIAFYEHHGYQRIPAFGPYADDPTSICYEKVLAPQNTPE